MRLRALAGGVALVLGASGCSTLCTETALAVSPMRLTGSGAPVLEARLTRDGAPFPGQQVVFVSLTSGPEGESLGAVQGYATTDGSGMARVTVRGGVEGMAMPGERAVGYRVEFTPLAQTDGEEYCSCSGQRAFR